MMLEGQRRSRTAVAVLENAFADDRTLRDLGGQSPLDSSTFESSWNGDVPDDLSGTLRGAVTLLAKGGVTGGDLHLMTPSRSYEEVLRKKRYIDWARLADQFVIKRSPLPLGIKFAMVRKEAYADALIGYYLNRLRFSGLPSAAAITPCFVQIIDWFKSKTHESQFTIMERAELSFEDFIKTGATPRQILAQLIMTLHALESFWEFYGGVHYDLHLGNLMLRRARPVMLADSVWTFERPAGTSASGSQLLRIVPADHGGFLPSIIDYGRTRIQVPFRGAELHGYTFDAAVPGTGDGTKFTRVLHVEMSNYGIVSGHRNVGPVNRGWDIRRLGVELFARVLPQMETNYANDPYLPYLQDIAFGMSGLDYYVERVRRDTLSGEVFPQKNIRILRYVLDAVRKADYLAISKMLDVSGSIGVGLYKALLEGWAWSPRVFYKKDGSLIYPRTPSDLLNHSVVTSLATKNLSARDASRPVEAMAVWRDPTEMEDTKRFTPVRRSIVVAKAVDSFVCSAPLCNRVGRRACGRCLLKRYCSEECQKRGWPAHRRKECG